MANRKNYFCLIIILTILFCKSQNKKIDSLRLVYFNAKHDTTKLVALNLIGRQIQNYYPDSALFYLSSAESEGEKLITKFLKNSKEWKYYSFYHAWTLNGLGIMYKNKNNLTKALEYYNKSLKINEEIQSKPDLANNLMNIGTIYYDKSDFTTALEYYTKSLEINRQINNKKGIGNVFANIANIFRDQGNFQAALDYNTKSLKMHEETGNKKSEAGCLNFMGIIYMEQKEFSLALDYYAKALKINEEIGDKRGVALNINNIGLIYYHLKEYKKAREYFERSLKIQEELKNLKGVALALNNIGLVKSNLGDFEGSLETYEKSLKIREAIGDKKGFISTNGLIGKLYFEQNNLNLSLEYLNRSLTMAKELGYAEELRNTASDLFKVHRALGNFNLAYENLELFVKMRDSITNIETQKAAIRQNAKYEYEKQQAIAQAAFDKQQVINQLKLKSKEVLIEKNKHLLLVLEKDNQLKSLNLLQRTNELKQKEIISENQQKKLDLLDKERKLITIQSEKRELDLKKQRIINYSLFAGVFLITIILVLSIRAYRQKKIDNITIQNQKYEVENQRQSLIEKNHLIEEKQKEILDSIIYAKRLQEAILPPIHFINETIPDSFVFYKPKDVVAGDFFWAEIKNDKFFIAAADSTGHGVPGAMVSVVCSNALNRSLNEFNLTTTGLILDKTRELVLETFSKGNSEVKDGMDISLLCIDKKNNKAFWGGANNPLWYIKDSEFFEIKADKQPIGKTDYFLPFSTHEIELKQGMQFYLFTDGFPDQFGGPKGKKFMYKKLQNLLVSISNKAMREQKEILEETFYHWKGDLEQVDDVCVIGLRV